MLVADDDALFREALAITLEDAGYEVVAVRGARAGAREHDERAFDVIVADIEMPGNRRLEWFHTLAASAPEVPLIIVTGHATVETAAVAVRLRAFAYLIKPVTAHDLCAEVARAVALRSRRDGVAGRVAIARERWQLTERQAQTLDRLLRGDSNKQIANALGCAVRTAELHVTAILAKSGHPTRTALLAALWSARGEGDDDEAGTGA
ncbi:MAG: response regulator [Sandaracinaceae bacterium]|nr:response regulator [Sandaracinaceae bacterium]